MHTSIKRKWSQGGCTKGGYFDAAKSNSKIWDHKVNNGVIFLLWCHWWNQVFEFGIKSGLVVIPFSEVVRFYSILWRCSISNIIQTFIMGHMYKPPFCFSKWQKMKDDVMILHDDDSSPYCTINYTTRSSYELPATSYQSVQNALCFTLHASRWIWTGMLP